MKKIIWNNNLTGILKMKQTTTLKLITSIVIAASVMMSGCSGKTAPAATASTQNTVSQTAPVAATENDPFSKYVSLTDKSKSKYRIIPVTLKGSDFGSAALSYDITYYPVKAYIQFMNNDDYGTVDRPSKKLVDAFKNAKNKTLKGFCYVDVGDDNFVNEYSVYKSLVIITLRKVVFLDSNGNEIYSDIIRSEQD